jgi:hypothetical protein
MPMSGSFKRIMRVVTAGVLLAIVSVNIVSGTAQAAAGWYHSAWDFRKEITIDADKVAGNLADFPVLVGLTTDADLAAKAQDDGDDILFAAADGTTKLSHEIEYFNDATGQLVAWVKVPALSDTTDTVIFMYYGNAAASNQEDTVNVWDSSFSLVQHLSETSGTHYDSTSSSNDGTYTGSGQNGIGRIDGGDDFNGMNEGVEINHAADLTFTGDYTVEAWVNLATSPQWSKHIVSKNGEYFLQVHGGNFIFAVTGPGWLYSVTPPAQDTWVHIAGVFHRGAASWGPHTMELYINGALDASYSGGGTPANTANNLFLGRSQTASYLNGSLDEVRISTAARSADWLQTSYNNQSDPAGFYTLGPEEVPVVAPAATTGDASPVEETSATLNGTLDDDGGEACEYRFEYGTDSGEPYSFSTAWTGSITTGQSFDTDITGLDKGTKYYFRAQLRNSAGTASGSELTLLTRPDAPVNGSFTVSVISGTQIDLSWTKGEGAQRTMVRAKEGSYPDSVTDGREVYFDTGTSVSDTGLSPDTTYYYRAWSEVTGSQQWSSSYVQTSATTGTAPPPPVAVGGTVYPVDKMGILLPWFCAAGALAVTAGAGVVFFVKEKRRISFYS